MSDSLTNEQWRKFQTQGYLRLGKVATEAELEALQQRMDDIMLGRAPLDYDRMAMQLDREPGTGKPGPQSKGHKGATLSYRKIQDLEYDPHFLAYMQKPLFRHICARVYGEETTVACYRAMFMNKPAGKGTHLPWHQDRFNILDTNPIATVWMALDRVTVENGCVGVVSGSHRSTFEQDDSAALAFLTEGQATVVLAETEPEYLELEAGEAALLHNLLLHGSGVNKTDTSRRGFSVCYMDAATRSESGTTFSIIFGEGALSPESL